MVVVGLVARARLAAREVLLRIVGMGRGRFLEKHYHRGDNRADEQKMNAASMTTISQLAGSEANAKT